MTSSILQVVSMQDIPEDKSVKKTGTPCHKEFRSFVISNRTPMSNGFLQSWGNSYDMQSARHAGVDFALALWGTKDPNLNAKIKLSHPKELLDIAKTEIERVEGIFMKPRI